MWLKGLRGTVLFRGGRPRLQGHASERSLGAAETRRGAADKCPRTLSPWVIIQRGDGLNFLNSSDSEHQLNARGSPESPPGDGQGQRPKARRGAKQ